MVVIRIPLAQYSYIEYEFDGTPFQAVAEHNTMLRYYQESLKEPEIQLGLSTKDWQRVLDTYMVEGSILEEDLDGMSEKQKGLINEIKKSINRIKSKQE